MWEFTFVRGWTDPLRGIVSCRFGLCVTGKTDTTEFHKQMVIRWEFYREKCFFGINDKNRLIIITRCCTQSTRMWGNIQWDVLDNCVRLTVIMCIYCVVTNAMGGNVRATLPESLICVLNMHYFMCIRLTVTWLRIEAMKWMANADRRVQRCSSDNAVLITEQLRLCSELNSLLETVTNH